MHHSCGNNWLTDYNAAHPGLDNVAVFDWFDVLAYSESHASHPNRLKQEYGGESGDSHPNATANSESTTLFASGGSNFLDAAWDDFNTNSVLVNVKIFPLTEYHNILWYKPNQRFVNYKYPKAFNCPLVSGSISNFFSFVSYSLEICFSRSSSNGFMR